MFDILGAKNVWVHNGETKVDLIPLWRLYS